MPKVTAMVSRETDHISLVQGHEYELIGIDDTFVRVVDESREPALHPKSYFLDSEISPPSDWEYRDYGNGEYAYHPREFSARGFFEDYADGQVAAILEFKRYLEHRNLL